MLVYSKLEQLSDEGFVSFDLIANWAKNIEGEFNARVRIDYQAGPVLAGIYRQDAAKADLSWPFTEHAFVLEGEVIVTDQETGASKTYGPGDGWIIQQGSRTTWETKGKFAKSFFGVMSQ